MPFLDQLLAPLRRNVPATKEAGTIGTPIYGGIIQTVEKNKDLTGEQKWTRYSEILTNTAIVAAGVRFFLNLTAKARWVYEPAIGGGPRAAELAQKTEEILSKIVETPFHKIVRRSAGYRFWGFSIQEWTAQQLESGEIGLLSVDARPQHTIERWDVEVGGRVAGVIQRSPQNFEEIYLPREKIVYLVDDSLTDSPEGLGLLRHVVKGATELEQLEKLEGYGFETDLRGMPVGRAPLAALEEEVKAGRLSKEDKDSIVKPLKTFIENHIRNPQLGLLLDSMTYRSEDDASTPSNVKEWDMSLLRAGSTSQEAIAQAIARKNLEMARTLGVENLLLGEGSSGSHALARDKSNNFGLIVDSTLQEIREVYMRDLVRRIFELNGWPVELMPTLKTEAITYRDIEQVTGALADLAKAGAILTPDDPAVRQVRDLLGLTMPEEINLMADSSLLPTRRQPNPSVGVEEPSPEGEQTTEENQ